MIVIVTVTLGGIHRDDAARTRNRAAHVLELNGGVVEVEAIAQHPVEATKNAIALRRRHVLDEDMTTESVRTRAQTPDVQIVNIKHAIDVAHGDDDIIEADAARKSLKEDIQRFTNDVPCGPDDQESNGDREDRVDLNPAGEADEQCADDDGGSSKKVAHHVNEGAADVEIVSP